MKDDFDDSLSGSTLPFDKSTSDVAEYHGEYPFYIGIGTWTEELIPEESSSEELLPLTHLETAVIISLLDDAINALIILKYVIGAPMAAWDFHYQTLVDKFTRKQTPVRIFPEVDSRPVLTPSLKLQKNREQIEVTFFKTMISLSDNGTFIPLENAISGILREMEDEKNLVKELRQNLECLAELKIKVEEKRKLDDIEEKERDELLYFLQDELDDVILKCEVEKKFVNKWENVRTLQNRWKHKIAEDYYTDNIHTLVVQTAIEQRVTDEWQAFLKLNQAEMEELLEEWMTKYDVELERKENKLVQLKYQKDQMVEKKSQLNQLQENKITEMNDWVAFRDFRRVRIKASLAIQSWWRGIMVRKKLDSLLKKKGKKGKKAKRKK